MIKMKMFAAAVIALFGLSACSSSTTNTAVTNSANNSNTSAQPSPAGAPKTEFSSVYTDMKAECKVLEEPPEEKETGGDPASACKGYGGYRIFISHSAWAAGFTIQNEKDPDVSIDIGMDYGMYGERGEKVEWRMAHGQPFAVIMRLGKYKDLPGGENPYTDKNRIGSTLVIKGLKGYEHIDFKVEGETPNGNEKAREMADQNYSKKS